MRQAFRRGESPLVLLMVDSGGGGGGGTGAGAGGMVGGGGGGRGGRIGGRKGRGRMLSMIRAESCIMWVEPFVMCDEEETTWLFV